MPVRVTCSISFILPAKTFVEAEEWARSLVGDGRLLSSDLQYSCTEVEDPTPKTLEERIQDTSGE